LDRVRIVEEARAQAYFEASHIRDEGARQARAVMLRVPPTTTPIHSSEISLREFPRSLRGVDAEAVSKWLALVEQSYALVEDELDRRRRELDDVLTSLGDMRRHLTRASAGDGERAEEDLGRARESWRRAVEITSSTVPATRLGFDTLVVRTSLMETPLRRRLMGYSREQVRRLLEASAAQLARLENQLHLMHAENERLRSLFLEQLPALDG
jgi:phytoene dehydrogenase-like protein